MIEINGAKFNIRPDSWDENIVRAVVEHNEYNIDISEGDVVVDIGGHIGSFAIMAGLKGANVTVYEPTKENFKMLVSNIKLNNLEDKITAINKAVVGYPRGYKIRFNEGNSGSSAENSNGYDVETITFAEVTNKDIDILKVDCEGAEKEFIIDKQNIKNIVGEVHYTQEFITQLKSYEVAIKPSKAKLCWIIKATKLE